VDELPWQLAQLRDWPAAFRLSVTGVLPCCMGSDEFEVRTLWSLVEPGPSKNRSMHIGKRWQTQRTTRRCIVEFGCFATIRSRCAVVPLWSFISITAAAREMSRPPHLPGNQAVSLTVTEPDEAMRLLKEQRGDLSPNQRPGRVPACLGNSGG